MNKGDIVKTDDGRDMVVLLHTPTKLIWISKEEYEEYIKVTKKTEEEYESVLIWGQLSPKIDLVVSQ